MPPPLSTIGSHNTSGSSIGSSVAELVSSPRGRPSTSCAASSPTVDLGGTSGAGGMSYGDAFDAFDVDSAESRRRKSSDWI
jgi:hypothetical protein